MTSAALRAQVKDAFIGACRAELSALKPGNVHRHSPGHGMEMRHFEVAAEAAAPFIADPDLSVGQRIEDAVAASFEAAGCNTNLGILLLSAPLAAAAERSGGSDLRQRLRAVLRSLDRRDAAHVFRAIVRANPAGLGRAETADVQRPAEVTLLEAMSLAAGRDRIALAYGTDYADIFEFGLPKLCAARKRTGSEDSAITFLHMAYLGTRADSHIERKHGSTAAEDVRRQAEIHLRILEARGYDAAFDGLLELDALLKIRGLNPGTTADFVVATLFASLLTTQS